MSRDMEDKGEIRLACVKLAGQSYGLDIMKISQIIRPQKIRPLPKAPEFLEGVINLRGMVIPIIDLRKRFALPIPEDKEPRVVIVTIGRQVVGVVVDEVTEVISLSKAEVQPSPNLEGIPSQFLTGALNYKGEILLILDLDEMLSPYEKKSLQEIKKLN